MTDRDAVRRGIERPWTNSCFVDDGTAPIVAAVDYFDDRGIPPQERPPPLPVTEADFALRRELAHQIMTGERPTLRDVAPMHATVSDLPKSAAEAMDRPAVLPRRAGSEPLPTTMATVSRVMSMPKTGPPTPRMPATPCSTSSDGLSVGGDRNAPMKKAKIVSSRSSGVFGNATANLKRWAVGVLQSRRSSTEAPEGYSPVESGGDDPPILYDPPCKSPRDRSSPRQHDAIDTAASKAASVEDPPLSSRSTDSQQQECWSILAIYPDIRQDPRYDEDRLGKLYPPNAANALS